MVGLIMKLYYIKNYLIDISKRELVLQLVLFLYLAYISYYLMKNKTLGGNYMKTVIGYVINTFRWNSMTTFGILGILSLYATIIGVYNIGPVFEALWYASAFDCFISAAIVIGLKSFKRV